MPRQGARRKQAASRKRRATADQPDDGPAATRGVKQTAKTSSSRNCAVGATAAHDSGATKRQKAKQRPPTGGRSADIESALAGPGDTSEKLFELANKPAVRLSVANGHYVEVAQDLHATEHSGGVVWETAVFLARYLEKHVLPGISGTAASHGRRVRVAELGSGCGLLGLALSRLGCNVLLTEQPSALQNLRANAVAYRESAGEVAAASSTKGRGPVKVSRLVWGEEADIAAARTRGPFDLVVASDVVFCVELVEPLLKSISGLVAAPDDPASADDVGGAGAATCWLCLQQRDPDAHAELMRRAPEYFSVREVPLSGLPGFEAAVELECLLLMLTLRCTKPQQDQATGTASALKAGARKRKRSVQQSEVG